MSEDAELEEIKRRKLEEYRRAILEAQRREAEKAVREMQKQQILRAVLTPEARSRLETVKMVRPEIVEDIENQIIQLAITGRIKRKIDDNQIKAILKAYQSGRREIRIIRR